MSLTSTINNNHAVIDGYNQIEAVLTEVDAAVESIGIPPASSINNAITLLSEKRDTITNTAYAGVSIETKQAIIDGITALMDGLTQINNIRG